MDKDARDVKQLIPWCDHAGLGHLLLAFCVCVLLGSQLANPTLVQSDQRINTAQSSADQGKAADSKVPAKPHKELSPAESSVQESKPAQLNQQRSKGDESKTKRESGEEGTEKGKEGTGRKAVSSLILTVKLALLGDPSLFPYEIEVKTGSDEVTLVGKVSRQWATGSRWADSTPYD